MAYPVAMDTHPSLPLELWERTPPEVQAYIWALEARIVTFEAMVQTLQEQGRTVQEQLNQTSRNSSRPPSSDPPQSHRPRRPPGKRRRGGQPGHPGHTRTLVPVEEVDEVVVLKPNQLSLSRLNHGQPGVQAHPKIVQGTADLHHEIADALLPQPDPVFHNTTTLHPTVDMLNPQSAVVERLVGPLLLQGQLLTAWLLRRHEDLHLRERERQEAQILQQPTPSREWVGGGLRDAQIMDPAAVGVAQKEDDEESIDEQDIFDGVVFFLAAIALLLFN